MKKEKVHAAICRKCLNELLIVGEIPLSVYASACINFSLYKSCTSLTELKNALNLYDCQLDAALKYLENKKYISSIDTSEDVFFKPLSGIIIDDYHLYCINVEYHGGKHV